MSPDELRDALAKFLSEMDHGDGPTFPPSAFIDDADAIVELLRANRGAVLQALGGTQVRREHLALGQGSNVPVVIAELHAFPVGAFAGDTDQ